MVKKSIKENERIFSVFLLVIELVLFVGVLALVSVPLFGEVYAVVGSPNVTVTTILQVGDVYPEILNVTVIPSTITLTPNATTNVTVYAVIRDYNGEEDIMNVSVIFWNILTSTYGSADDKNRHYNASCELNASYGSPYEVNATCIVPLEYFAEAGTWNATATVYDNSSRMDRNSTTSTVNALLAIGLPDSINYGTVNSTEVSQEQIANITNFGNTAFNVSLQGYAHYLGDGVALNCTLGTIKNISINYEKYNMTDSIAGLLSLSEFEGNYTNMTSSTVVVRKMNNGVGVPYRQLDSAPYGDDTNASYWRVYVPVGVAGSCRGNIVFGAVQSEGLG